MKILLIHKDKRFNAQFEAYLTKDEYTYGNGYYMSIYRNGEFFKYVDCRYEINFEPHKIFERIIRDHYGNNLKALKWEEN